METTKHRCRYDDTLILGLKNFYFFDECKMSHSVIYSELTNLLLGNNDENTQQTNPSQHLVQPEKRTPSS